MPWLRSLDFFRQDLSYAWRSLRRTPGFTAMVVATLALGIGVNAAMFTFLDRVLLRNPSGVRDPDTIHRVWIERTYDDGTRRAYQGTNYRTYLGLRDAAGESGEVAYYTRHRTLTLGRNPDGARVQDVHATSNLFKVLGARVALGRFYQADEDRVGAGAKVVVLSDAFWRAHFDGDPGVVGKTMELSRKQYTIIGVAAPEFNGIDDEKVDMWIPLGAFVPSGWKEGEAWWDHPSSFASFPIVRAGPAFDEAGFNANATHAVRDVRRSFYPTSVDTTSVVRLGSVIAARGPGEWRPELRVAARLAGVTATVLLIACANVVNLLLARFMQRRREIAVRLALGVSRIRLLRLLATETVLLAIIAGAISVLIAWWGGGVLRTLLFPDIEFGGSPMDARVVWFTGALALLAGLFAGLVAALQASKPELTSALKAGKGEGGTPRSLLRSGLVVLQAAFSVVLVVGAALFVRSLQNVQAVDIGFDTDRLLFADVSFAEDSVSYGQMATRLRDVESRLQGRPGVERIARSYLEPMNGWTRVALYRRGEAEPLLHSTVSPVSSMFFETVGIRLLRGRTFLPAEQLRAPELVVNEALARKLWPGVEPLGQCLAIEEPRAPCSPVVGVVETVRVDKIIGEEEREQLYVPVDTASGVYWAATVLVVRTRAGVESVAEGEVRQALRSVFPAGYVRIASMSRNLERQYRPFQLGATLFTAFGLLALMVAIVGIYSTVSYGVSQRVHEFGVRLALGAKFHDILQLVVGQGVRVVFVGLIVGIVLALAAGQLIASLLYGIDARDPSTMLFAAAALLVAAIGASVIPAWRAARVDPATALRAD
jgi:predicted permease